MGGLGGGVEGLVVELYNWMNGEGFDWGNVGFKASVGAALGVLHEIARVKYLGTAVRLSQNQKLALIDFALGVSQGVLLYIWQSKKGLDKIDSGIAMHNIMIDAMVEALW